MTVPPSGAELAEQRVLAEITRMLLTVTGEDEQWAATVTPASRLEGDLRLEIDELAAVGGLLRDTYGARADLAGFLADLDIDEVIGLTVGDLVAYVVPRCPVTRGSGTAGSAGSGTGGSRADRNRIHGTGAPGDGPRGDGA